MSRDKIFNFRIMSYLWRVKALQDIGIVAKGMEVDVVKSNTNAKPNIKKK